MALALVLVSIDERTRISVADIGTSGRCLGRRDVAGAPATVSREQCRLFPAEAHAGQLALTVESCGTNPTGVRKHPAADWRWLGKNEHVGGVTTGWQLALDRALQASALFTVREAGASLAGTGEHFTPAVADEAQARTGGGVPAGSGPRAAASRPVAPAGLWWWARGDGWSRYSHGQAALVEGAWAAGATSVVLDAERRVVFDTMRQARPASGGEGEG
eukprot:scaffold23153_cov135-Isochrysis_galbana.AAC.3